MALNLVLIVVFAGYTASFVCVVLERRLDGRRPDGRSMCACGAPIPMYRNIPVLSWVLQRGRAHCCGARIPVWYVLAELTAVVAALLGAWMALPHPWLGGVAGTALSMAGVWWWHSRTHRSPN